MEDPKLAMESREGLMSGSSKAPGVQVELAERSPERPPPSSDAFFSWIKDRDRKTSIRDAKIIPWKGIIALAISVLTTLASMVVLLVLQNRGELFPTTGIYRVMQPASWLSALMSVNGAALHVALIEGVTVAWWYRATRPSANLDQLHSLWSTGTSSFSAARHLQKLSTVSLAALFVAILPLNGFLLQAAVTTPVTTVQQWSTIPVPMARTLPLGYSGNFAADNGSTWGLIDLISSPTTWPSTFQQIKNIAGSKYANYAYIGAYDQCGPGSKNCTDTYLLNETAPSNDHLLGKRYYFNDTLSTFSFRAQGTGFNISCEESKIAYDLLPVEGKPAISDSIFLTVVDWDYNNPNVITVEMKWKPDKSCQGEYEHRLCTLKAATVEYPVEMQLDVAKIYRGPYFSLPVNSTWQDDKVIKELDVYANESVDSTTFGGIALLFSEWYDANTTFTFRPDGSWLQDTYGPLGYAIDPGYWDGDISQSCYVSMSWGLSFVNYFSQLTKRDYKMAVEFGPWDYIDVGSPIDLVLNQMRQSMFFASIYQGAGWWAWSFNSDASEAQFERTGEEGDFIQTVDALRTKNVPTYRIRWGLWGASVAMTYAVICLILPTFYGFWVLKVKPSLSPIDVARALNAPVVDHDAQNHMHVSDLLKEIGRKNIHHDLRR